MPIAIADPLRLRFSLSHTPIELWTTSLHDYRVTRLHSYIATSLPNYAAIELHVNTNGCRFIDSIAGMLANLVERF